MSYKAADDFVITPAIGSMSAGLHPFLALWAVLLGLSSLARYEPAAWSKMIDIDASAEAQCRRVGSHHRPTPSHMEPIKAFDSLALSGTKTRPDTSADAGSLVRIEVAPSQPGGVARFSAAGFYGNAARKDSTRSLDLRCHSHRSGRVSGLAAPFSALGEDFLQAPGVGLDVGADLRGGAAGVAGSDGSEDGLVLGEQCGGIVVLPVFH